jgi:hypothetical protein
MTTVANRAERARSEKRKAPAVPTSKPSEEEIRLLAYRLYERRCESGLAGDAAEDWIEAERELSSRVHAARGNGD